MVQEGAHRADDMVTEPVAYSGTGPYRARAYLRPGKQKRWRVRWVYSSHEDWEPREYDDEVLAVRNLILDYRHRAEFYVNEENPAARQAMRELAELEVLRREEEKKLSWQRLQEEYERRAAAEYFARPVRFRKGTCTIRTTDGEEEVEGWNAGGGLFVHRTRAGGYNVTHVSSGYAVLKGLRSQKHARWATGVLLSTRVDWEADAEEVAGALRSMPGLIPAVVDWDELEAYRVVRGHGRQEGRR